MSNLLNKDMLTFLDFFAGVGGFRRGMEMAGHKCLGHCEWDKYANASYEVIHDIEEGEWFGRDIRDVRASELPRADVWCFGFPCQDISVAGKQLGFDGKRSSLFFTVTRLIRDTQEENRPKYLFIENVKNLFSVNGGTDFLKLLIELDEIGYDAEWQLLNSWDFGLSQNRERVFIIGHNRSKTTSKVLPIETSCRRDSKAIRKTIRGTGKNCSGCLTTRQKQYGRKELDTLIYDYKNKTVRVMTPLEFAKCQGWTDDDFNKVATICADNQLYKQFGNGVSIPVIYEIAKRLE